MLAFTTDYNGESKNTEAIKRTLARIAEAGFTHVHWGHEWSGDYTYSIYEILQIKGWLSELGLAIKGIHAADGEKRHNTKTKYHHVWTGQNTRSYSSENELNRLAGVELIKNRLDMAHELGAGEIVLHMQLPYKDFEADPRFQDRYYSQVFRSFDELEPYCRARGIRLCVENLLGTPAEHLIRQFDLLFGRYGGEFLGLCFDTGHANVVCRDTLELARRYVDRVFCIHVSDNHGLSSALCWEDGAAMRACDEHLLPFEGNFDWDGFARVLAASPYEPPCILETLLKGDENEACYLKRAFNAGTRVSELFFRYRAERSGSAGAHTPGAGSSGTPRIPS
jgi:sugar phosphate isomerase/epimerase